MKLIDCFIFYNELDLLEYRLKTYSDVVDYFVLVEATDTIQGEPKPLFFERAKERFKEFLPKIIHVVVDDMPNDLTDAFVNEGFQRNCIDRGLKRLSLDPTDLILISDADEFPSKNLIKAIKNIGLDDLHVLLQDYYMYSINYKVYDKWYYAKILPYNLYCTIYKRSPQMLREIQQHQKDCNYLTRGGWHFSYFGKPEVLWQKINAFSLGGGYRKQLTLEDVSWKLDNGIGFYTNEPMDYLPVSENPNPPPNLELLLQLFPPGSRG